MSEYVKMSRQLSNVVAITDMDGFTINKKFYCKELALLKVGDVAVKSFFFDFGLRKVIYRRKMKERVDMSKRF